MIKNGENKICLMCKKYFYVSGYRKNKAICCSPECLFKVRGINKDKCLNHESIYCQIHGLHNEWRYKKSNSNTICRKCLRDKMNMDYKDPNKKIKKLLNYARHRAKKYNREFSIDREIIDNLLKLQNNSCAISGINFIDNDPLYEMSIDRIDSGRGYTPDNIQPSESRIPLPLGRGGIDSIGFS